MVLRVEYLVHPLNLLGLVVLQPRKEGRKSLEIQNVGFRRGAEVGGLIEDFLEFVNLVGLPEVLELSDVDLLEVAFWVKEGVPYCLLGVVPTHSLPMEIRTMNQYRNSPNAMSG